MVFGLPVIQSCCCWRSLKTASYAVVVYSFFFYNISIVILTQLSKNDKSFLLGRIASNHSRFLDSDTIDAINSCFNTAILISVLVGNVGTLLLLYGLCTNKRNYLLPWMVCMSIEAILEISHWVFMIVLELVHFNPITAVLFTVDIFLIGLEIYSVVCVNSQYMRYREFDMLAAMHEEEGKNDIPLIQLNRSGEALAPNADPDNFDDDEPSTSAQITVSSTPKPGPPLLLSPGHRRKRPANRRVRFPNIGPMDDGITSADGDY